MIALRLLARGLTRPALTLLGASTIFLVGCRTTPVVPTSAVLVQPTVENQPVPVAAPTATTAVATTPTPASFTTANTTITQADWVNDPYARRKSVMDGKWRKGEALLQGYLGVSSVQDFAVSGSNGQVEAGTGSISQYPVIGGGAQWKLAGERVDFGIEGLMSIGGRANGGAFYVGGGGAVIAVSLDMLIVDFYGGPFVSLPLGKSARLYGSLGPMVQFISYHQSGGPVGTNGSSSGFGIGGYARTGFEIEMAPGSYIGIGVRWFDSKVDLSSTFGDLDMQSVEAMLTFSVMG